MNSGYKVPVHLTAHSHLPPQPQLADTPSFPVPWFWESLNWGLEPEHRSLYSGWASWGQRLNWIIFYFLSALGTWHLVSAQLLVFVVWEGVRKGCRESGSLDWASKPQCMDCIGLQKELRRALPLVSVWRGKRKNKAEELRNKRMPSSRSRGLLSVARCASPKPLWEWLEEELLLMCKVLMSLHSEKWFQ